VRWPLPRPAQAKVYLQFGNGAPILDRDSFDSRLIQRFLDDQRVRHFLGATAFSLNFGGNLYGHAGMGDK
jgi:hypothetical protein